MKIAALLLFITTSTLLMSYMLAGVSAQPTWSFRIELLPAKLYMGEWGTICANITNTDCRRRVNYVLKLEGIVEDELDAIVERIKLMEETGFIKGHEVVPLNLWGYGGKIYGDYEIYLSGVCIGESIPVVSAGLWFPWRGYGRDLASWRYIGRELSAFNPINVVQNGADPDSSLKVCFNYFIPPDLPPEEKEIWPKIDIRVRFPGWIEYTLEDLPLEGVYELQPYRSFNLTITDFDGVLRLSGAEVVLKQLIHYYRFRRYVTPENGTIRIWRLLDGKYMVSVDWNSSYPTTTTRVFFGYLTAYKLASMKVLRTRLFTLRINPLDMKNRPLRGARIIFDGFEEVAGNGTAIYTLVPEGNHTAEIYWKGVRVFDGWLWAGYHPTIYPWMTRPARIHNLKLPVDDLVIHAVDTGGAMIGVNYTVEGPNEELSFRDIYRRNGSLLIEQLPIMDYHVKAVNCSERFRRCVEAEGDYKPGKISKIILPIHSVSLRILTQFSKPLRDAVVKLGPISLRSGEDGSARFIGVPRGVYRLTVRWRNLTVYDGSLNVEMSAAKEVKTQVYRIALKFLTKLGKRYPCLLNMTAPGGINVTVSHPSDSFELEYVPEGSCDLSIYTFNGIKLVELEKSCSELSRVRNVELPISDMMIKVAWSDGEPIEGCMVSVDDVVHEIRSEGLTDENGTLILKDMIFSNYTIRINYPYTPIPVKIFNETFRGDEINVRVEEAWLRVRVVDLLGNPIEGAEVSLFYGLTPLAKLKTGADGSTYFERVPKLPAYAIHVRYGTEEKKISVTPNEYVDVKMNVFQTGNIQAILQYAVAAAIIIAIIIISVKLVLHVRSVLR